MSTATTPAIGTVAPASPAAPDQSPASDPSGGIVNSGKGSEAGDYLLVLQANALLDDLRRRPGPETAGATS